MTAMVSLKPEKPVAMNTTVMNKARLNHVYVKYPLKTNWEKYRVQRSIYTKQKRKSLICYFNERWKGAIQMFSIKTVHPPFTLTKA